MDNRRYNQIENSVRTKYNQMRSQFGVGENSDDNVCNAKNYYLVVDNKPAIDPALQRISGSTWNFDGTVDTKVYTVHTYTQQELDDRALAESLRIAKIGLGDTDELMMSDVNSSLSAQAQSDLTTFRSDCIVTIETGVGTPVMTALLVDAVNLFKV